MTRKTSKPQKTNPLGRWQVLLAAVLLSLPLAAMHLGYWWAVQNGGEVYTGYVQYDQPYYVVLGVQYFHEGIHLHAANVFGPDASPARVYFLFPLFLFGAIQHLSGLAPALVFNLCGWLAAVGMFYQLVRLIEQMITVKTPRDWLVVLCCAWGGGLFALGGFYNIMLQDLSLQALFRLDPANGFWMLNLGRNTVFPTEAAYHLLFLLLLRYLLAARHWAALITLLLLSLSSPFTGLHALCFVIGWWILEKLFFGRAEDAAPPFVILGLAAGLFVYHLALYLVILPVDDLHRITHEQNLFDWQLDTIPMLLGYSLVGALALAQIWRLGLWRLAFLKHRGLRLGLVLFGISFGLANNEMLLSEPVQPLHFTRGYLWLGLMLAGLPVLQWLYQRLRETSRPVNWLATLMVSVLFLSDNIAWLATLPHYRRQPVATLTTYEDRILAWFTENPDPDARVLWADPGASMILYTRTHMRSWMAHQWVTPHADTRLQEQTQALLTGELTDEMRRYDLYVVLDGRDALRFLALYRQRSPQAPAPEAVCGEGRLAVLKIPKTL